MLGTKKYLGAGVIAVFAFLFLSATFSFAGETVTNYYDDLNRLEKAEFENRFRIEYSYDDFGNRTQKKITLLAMPAPAMPAPTGAASYSYSQVETPVISFDPASSKPIAVVNSAGSLTIKVGFSLFASPVDIYLALYAPDIDPHLYYFTPANTLQADSDGIVKWRENSIGPIDEIIMNVPLSSVALSTYDVYAMVMPAGSTANYYFWFTSFMIPPVTAISGDITANTTWGATGDPADTEYLLNGTVYVKAPAELTIQPGTKIYGDRTDGRLVVERGAKIHAVGTPYQPIVFTSKAVILEQTPARGDWGGVVIAGKAPVNVPGGEGSYLGVPYGGSDPNDNSGELRYVRVEYAGSADSAEKGMSFYGVGSGTAVDHVEVYMGGGDCIEMFGGTVNLKYMVGSWCGLDALYWTEGWTGKAQFIIGSQRADQLGRGTGAYNNISGHDNLPRSNPLIYNMTMVGDPYTTWGTASARGMALMSGSAGRIYNSIFTDFKLQGVAVDDTATVSQGNSGNLVVGNGIVFGNNSGGVQYDTDAQNLINTGRWTNLQTVDPGLCNPLPDDIYAYIDASKKYMPNFAPASGSPSINGTVPVATPPADGFFTAVNFIGAVDPNNDWTYGWTTFGSAKQRVGDLDYNDTVNVLDVVKVKKIASSVSPYQSCSDIDKNGAVNILDVVKVKRRASGSDSPTVCCTE